METATHAIRTLPTPNGFGGPSLLTVGMNAQAGLAPTGRRTTCARARLFDEFEARSSAMRSVFETIDHLAPTEVTVTLCGETGTGKDVLARTIHDRSVRSAGPFVVFDCGAVAPNLAESELLGHERGAFTGAIASHAGAFERANGGTLFLDEIGDLPRDLQPRLLRALENREVRRVGGTESRPLDVRVVAATNRDLRLDIAAGRFRQDLFFRLGAAVLVVPPLRERLDELPLLVPRLLDDLGRGDLRVAESVYALLRSHAWPGNIRELKNALACALAFVEGDTLSSEHLDLLMHDETKGSLGKIERLPLAGHKLEHIERAAIAQTLKQVDGNKTRAAQLLGIAISTLYQKLKRYCLWELEPAAPPEANHRSIYVDESFVEPGAPPPSKKDESVSCRSLGSSSRNSARRGCLPAFGKIRPGASAEARPG